MKNQRTINLYSGGTLTLSGDFNYLELLKDDRDFMASILDAMERWYVSEQQELERP